MKPQTLSVDTVTRKVPVCGAPYAGPIQHRRPMPGGIHKDPARGPGLCDPHSRDRSRNRRRIERDRYCAGSGFEGEFG